MDLDLSASYDSGHFDKDEQGWCARRKEIRHVGDWLSIRSWGDDNGARAYDSTTTLRVGEHLPELGLVRLLNEPGHVVGYFDLNRRQLRPLEEQEVERFTPPAGYTTQAAREALGAALAPVARALGLVVGEAPEMALGEMSPSATAQGALEVHGESRGETAVWRWMRRYFPDGGSARIGPHQTAVEIEGLGLLRREVKVFVQAPDYANFVIHGPVEAMPRAFQWRARAMAEWTSIGYLTEP